MKSFFQTYGHPPHAVADAPGRVNLLGEHTDYNDGFVLPTAIPQRTRVAVAAVSAGSFSATLPVTSMGRFVFVATTGGTPGSGDEMASPAVTVQVADATTGLDKPAARVDSLKKPTLTGSVVPARAGVRVHLDVRVGTGLVGDERLAALEAECARLIPLGAVRVRLLLADGVDESCLVMQDVEGNEFCLD